MWFDGFKDQELLAGTSRDSIDSDRKGSEI